MVKILANDGISDAGLKLLENNNFQVNTERIDQENLIKTINSENYLSEDDIKEISMLKIAKIGSHCCNHLRLNLLTNEQIYSELKDSKRVLEEIVGDHVENISYPHGGYNKYVLDILPSLGYKYAASSIKGKNNSKTNRYLLNRIEIIKSDSIKKIVNKINGYYDYY